MPAAIVTDTLGKRYRLGDRVHYGRLTEAVAQRISSFLARRDAETAGAGFVWALRDVSLEIEPGEVVGFVGRNGAGKTTLLKLLSRVTEPTTGSARLRGKVGSLLEVGTGFHPELTGRENVYLSGAILGMRRVEIRRKFGEIVDFADVGPFVDTPVKRYSSGMQVRLGFAVAAHLETEILIVDEVLAVGDAEFQRRCLGKMEEASRADGRTILFVSHNMQSIRTICTRAVFLEDGVMRVYGEAPAVVREYLEHATQVGAERRWEDPARRPGDADTRLLAVRVVGADGRVAPNALAGEPLRIELELEVLQSAAGIAIGFDLETDDGVGVLSSFQLDSEFPPPLWAGRTVLRAELPPDLLAEGGFVVSPRIVTHAGRVVAHERAAVHFDVTGGRRVAAPHLQRGGAVAPAVAWTGSGPADDGA